MSRLLKNKCQCRICGDIIESKYRHDYVRCGCGSIATDGGIDYIHRSFKNPDDIIDLSEYWDEDESVYPGKPVDSDDLEPGIV